MARLLPSDVSFVVIPQQQALCLMQHPTPKCAAKTDLGLKKYTQKSVDFVSKGSFAHGVHLV